VTRRCAVWGAAVVFLGAATEPLPAGDIPEATLVLEATIGLPGRVSTAAPPRFVLLRDRRAFVGGTDRIFAGLLDKDEAKSIEERVKQLRKRGLLSSSVSFGRDTSKKLRLRLLEDSPLDVVVTGDPAQAPPALAPLAEFLGDLLRFHHPSLRPFAPEAFALSVREGALAGGCRTWQFGIPLEDARTEPRRVSAAEAERWPTGANPASVCAGGRRFVVTLRPLLPGEAP
jgi:hypothetical protein